MSFDARQAFQDEARELLVELESALLELDQKRQDPEVVGRAFRALHGVNNGPLDVGGTVDLSASHRAIGVPLVRLHDTHWPNPDVVVISERRRGRPGAALDRNEEPIRAGPSDQADRALRLTGAT